MTNTKKILFLSTMILTVSSAWADDSDISIQYPFSNVIFFGDSLSDIGNGPESLTLSGDDTGSGLFTNTYVPISNPVDPDNDSILSGIELKFPPMDQSSKSYKAALPPQLQLCQGGNCVKRKFLSLNWVEYFVYNAVLLKLIAPGVDLRPWVIQYQETDVDHHQSVDYAFYSALSGDACGDFDLNPVPCRFHGLPLQASVFAKQNIYRNEQSKTDALGNRALREQVIIPGLRKQIEMFRRDKNRKRVMVDDNTLYVVFIGANDISRVFFEFVDGKTSLGQFLQALNVTIPREIASKRYLRSGVNRLIQLGAKKIRVLGQYNIGTSPEIFSDAGVDALAEKHVLAAALSVLVSLYNHSLRRFVSEYTDQGEVDVEYVDLQSPMEEVMNQFCSLEPDDCAPQGYFFTTGERCISAVQPLIAAGGAASCFHQDPYITGAPIGFWNDAHLSTQYYQVIASTLLSQLTGGTQDTKAQQTLDTKKSLNEVEEILMHFFRSEKGR